MTRRQTIGTAAALMLALGAAAEARAQDSITLGMALGQTGYLAPFDGPAHEGMRIAIDEINADGGIGGKLLIETLEKDVRSDPAQTAIAVQELIDAGVSVLIVPCDADPAFAAAALANEAQVPAFSTCASSPTLPRMGGDYMFANFPGDNVQAAVSAAWAHEQGFTTAYVLYSPDTQYTTLPLYFADVFERLGGEVVGQGTYSLGQQDFSAEVTRIRSLEPAPEVIMTSAYEPDFPAFLRQLRAAGVAAQVIGSDAIDSPTTLALGDVADGLVFTTAGFPTPGSAHEAFNEKYEAAYGKPSETVFNPIGYDLIKVIEAAVLAADLSTDPQTIHGAILGLEDVQGATSTITYKGTDGMPIRQVSLVRVEGGAPELIGQPAPDPALIPEPRMN